MEGIKGLWSWRLFKPCSYWDWHTTCRLDNWVDNRRVQTQLQSNGNLDIRLDGKRHHRLVCRQPCSPFSRRVTLRWRRRLGRSRWNVCLRMSSSLADCTIEEFEV